MRRLPILCRTLRATGRLGRDRRGVTAVEFAIAGPVFLLLLFGSLDLGHTLYVSSLLRGAVQQAARDSTLETADTDELDAYVGSIVSGIAPGADISVERKSYYDFEDVGRAETWNDANNDSTCNNGEAYTDENGNGHWDGDVGVAGNGSASDSVLYTVTMSYKPLFPIPFIAGSENSRTIVASAFKKNQPYSLQADYGSAAGTCN